MKAFTVILIQILISTLRNVEATEPLYYGWFFRDLVASGLTTITENHLESLNSNVIVFQNLLRTMAELHGINDPLKYYTKPTDPNSGEFDPDFHVTAYYCGFKDCTPYTNKVKNFLGTNFTTEMVGLFFTPRTYGIRVKLSDAQESIFDVTRDKRSTHKAGKQEHDDDDATNYEQNLIAQIPRSSLRSEYPGIEFIEQDDTNFHPTHNRAHVTVGCAPNVSAVATGTDLLEIIELEAKPEEFCANISTTDGIFVNMGKQCDIFMYYLKEKMVANATFQVYNRSSGHNMNFSLSSFKWLLLPIVPKWLNV